MFDWLFEGRPIVYGILGLAAAVLLALWWRDRKRHWLVGVLGVLLLGVAYFLLDRLVQTPRKQVVRAVKEMAGGVQARNLDGIMSHVSDQFRYRGLDRSAFRGKVQTALAQNWVDQVIVWDFEFPDAQPAGALRVVFKAKPLGGALAGGSDLPFFRCEGEFVRDPDGRWRMKTFEVFHPFIETKQPLEIPQLGP